MKSDKCMSRVVDTVERVKWQQAGHVTESMEEISA